MSNGDPGQSAQRILGRYALFDEIAAGGMATVHIGRMLGPVGFAKTVAIKRLHANLARDPEFVSMFLDEARLAARIQHPNVVSTLDVVAAEGEVFLVLDFVQGESLSHLLKATRIKNFPVDLRIIASILVNTLHGLHAAHEAQDEHGRPLDIVHRDVSPQNILVGVDGVARVLDFGVAKAAGRLQSTRDGQLKGKLAYMAPEQIRGEHVDRRTDIYAASAVLWEALVGRRLVHGLNEGQVLATVLAGGFPPPSSQNPALPRELDALVMRGLAMSPAERWPTARELAIGIERVLGVASPYQVAEWVQSVGAEAISMRAARVREMESTSAVRVSLHDPHAPLVSHEGPHAFRAGGSVVTSPSISAALEQVQAPAREVSGSVRISPALIPPPQEASQPSYPYTGAGFAQPPLPVGMGGATKPTSRVAVVLISVVVSAVLGLSVIALLLWLRGRQSPAESTIEGLPGAAESAVDTRPKPAPTPTPVAPPPVVAEPVPIPVASATEKAKPPETTKPADKPPPVTTTTAKPATTQKPSATQKPKPPKGCDSPFYVDANGIKHVKPECM